MFNENHFKLGNGLKKYVENINFPLLQRDCEKIAKHKYNLDYISKIKYECDVDFKTKININDKVFVNDIILDLSYPFRCVAIKYEHGYDIENKKLKLELPYGARN